jgi:DNA-binding MarR family transcriptional regulator
MENLNASPAADAGQGPDSQDMAMAVAFRTTITRLIKLLRRETRNEAQLSLTERSTLGLLYPDNRMAPSEIARTEMVTTQSMSQVINHLAELQYIDRTPSDDDKRKTLLSLTPAGKDYVEQIRRDKQEWLARALHERTNAAEKELLMRSLEILNKLMEEDK